MKRIYNNKYLIIFCFSLLALTACKKNFLDRQPDTATGNTPVDPALVWSQPALALGVLANYYSRIPGNVYISDFNNEGRSQSPTRTDDALSGSTNTGNNTFTQFPLNESFENLTISGANLNAWQVYFTLIRDVNLAIENLAATTASTMTAANKTIFTAELRFIRAYVYFELVKRVGGIPIVTSTQLYDYSGDPTYLQTSRNTEAEVYNFIGSEVDAIGNDLRANTNSKTRANYYAALALKSRAMLYAGSIAQYNSARTPSVTLAGGAVGMSQTLAAGFYQKSLDASRLIIGSGAYALYRQNPNLGENFYDMYMVKGTANTEAIFVRDYLFPTEKHNFPYDNIARSIREDNLSSSTISPTLNLVESFEYLNGTSSPLVGVGTGSNTAAGQTWTFYNTPQEIFAGRDARLYGNIAYPGTTLKGSALDIQAGVYVWNAGANKYDRVEGALGSLYTDSKTLTGLGGPLRNNNEVTPTGFYMRKMIDPVIGSSNRGRSSDSWFIRFRLGEIYLNAAEAALELGLIGEALTDVNLVRERAGFGANSLTTLNLEKLQNERRVELAFEDHRFWDVKRWRIAHTLWTGAGSSASSVRYALFPYRVVHPGNANDGKWVFDKIIGRDSRPLFFDLPNYYSQIPQAAVDANPKIVRNPLQ